MAEHNIEITYRGVKISNDGLAGFCIVINDSQVYKAFLNGIDAVLDETPDIRDIPVYHEPPECPKRVNLTVSAPDDVAPVWVHGDCDLAKYRRKSLDHKPADCPMRVNLTALRPGVTGTTAPQWAHGVGCRYGNS